MSQSEGEGGGSGLLEAEELRALREVQLERVGVHRGTLSMWNGPEAESAVDRCLPVHKDEKQESTPPPPPPGVLPALFVWSAAEAEWGENVRERCPSLPPLGAPTGDRTRTFWCTRQHSNQLNHPARSSSIVLCNKMSLGEEVNNLSQFPGENWCL